MFLEAESLFGDVKQEDFNGDKTRESYLKSEYIVKEEEYGIEPSPRGKLILPPPLLTRKVNQYPGLGSRSRVFFAEAA